MRRYLALLFFTLTLTFFAEPTEAQNYRYTLAELLPLTGGTVCRATAIATDGKVIGYSESSQGQRAVLWNGAAPPQSLGVLRGSSSSIALGINANGWIVGASSGSVSQQAFLWVPGRGMKDISVRPGEVRTNRISSGATAINNNGQIIGTMTVPQGPRAFLWTEQTGMQDLGVLPGFRVAVIATALNDANEVVGFAQNGRTDRAFLWTRQDGMRDLGTLPGDTNSRALGINASGQIVGVSWKEQRIHAFIWTELRRMQYLATLPGGTYNSVRGINALGQMTGWSESSSGVKACTWTPAGVVRDISTVITNATDWNLPTLRTLGLNDSGVLIAECFRGDYLRPVLLTPAYTTPLMQTFQISRTSAKGGERVQATIALNKVAPAGGQEIGIAVSLPLVTVPSIVTVPAGRTSFVFDLLTTPVATNTNITLRATDQNLFRDVTLTLQPPAISSLILTPTRVRGGALTGGSVILDSIAPPGGLRITLTSANPALASLLTQVVVIPAGARTSLLDIRTARVTVLTNVNLSATSGGVTKTATLTLIP